MNQDIKELKEELRALQEAQRQLARRTAFLAEKVAAMERGAEANVSPPPLKEEAPVVPPQPMMERIESKKQRENLEFRIGGTWFSRIGIVAVIVALAYFLKYAIDNDWIGPTGRVVSGIFAGIGLLFAGEKLRGKYPGYAQVLLGGGSLALYFSIYAGYSFYELYSSVITFLLLVLVMANTVFMSVRHDSLPIGVLGIIGAYSIPFVIGSAEPSLWTLYGYLTIVTAGVLAVSIYKKWSVFQFLSFFIVQIIVLITHGTGDFGLHFMFILLMFAFYLGIATVYNIRKGVPSIVGDLVLIFLNAATFFAWSSYLLEDTFMADYMGFYAVFLAVIYLYIGKMSYTIAREDIKRVYTLFLVSFVLVTIAIPLQLNGYFIGFAWFAEALGLGYIALRLNRTPAMYAAIGVFFLGLFESFFEIFALWNAKWFFFNAPTFLFLFGIGVSYLLARMAKKLAWPRDLQKVVPGLLYGLFLTFIFFVIILENHDFFARADIEFFLSPEQLSLSALWIIYAIVLFTFGMKRQNPYMRYSALGLMAITVIKAFFIDLASLSTLFKIILFIILGLSLLGVSYYYQRKKDEI